MDITARILVSVIVFGVCSGVVRTGQLYLQPANEQVGYFTDDSFFTTCFTTDESMDKLVWKGPQGDVISDTKGRLYVEQSTEERKGLKLLIEGIQKEDEGQYVCSDDEVSVSFQVYVYRSISFGDTPSVQYVKEGENPIIKCNPKGQNPKISWHFNKNKLTNGEKYRLDSDGNSLTVYNVNREDAGVYTCSVYIITTLKTQFKGMNISVVVQFKPEIHADQKNETYGRLHTPANLSCSAIAEPVPDFEWEHDGELLQNNSEFTIYNTENTSMLKLNDLDESHFGEYICIASNILGREQVIIELREGDTPTPPSLTVLKEENGEIFLDIKVKIESNDEDLEVTGFKVQYSTEKWPSPIVQEFSLGDQHVLRNISANTEYKLSVAARNAAGYGDYSEEIAYKTHDLQDVHMTASSGVVINLSFTTLILIAILL